MNRGVTCSHLNVSFWPLEARWEENMLNNSWVLVWVDSGAIPEFGSSGGEQMRRVGMEGYGRQLGPLVLRMAGIRKVICSRTLYVVVRIQHGARLKC